MKVMSVFGTRPEAIKMAPLVRALQDDPDVESVLCVTAQHRQMLDQVLDLFELTPDYDLNIMQPNQTISMITANVLTGMEPVLQKEKPDVVLVHGDTSTTFVTALACFYQQIAVGHVEAGLRTYDKYSPFPEEMNRVLTGHIADIHFAPTERNRQNLLAESIADSKIVITGNTVIDALLQVAGKPYEFEDETLKTIDFEHKKVITVTCHRRENLGEYMAHIFSAIADIAREFEDEVEVVYPVHLNPKVRAEADEYLKGIGNVHLIEPLTYQPFVNLMASCQVDLYAAGLHKRGSDAVERYAHIDLKERFRLMCFAFGEPVYEVDDNLAIIERETVDKVQSFLDGLNGDEMERLLEMLKKKKPD